MKILLISYDYYLYDGRLRELIKVARALGETTFITRSSDGEKPQGEGHILYRDRGYSHFILFVCQQMQKIGPQDLILIDNRKGIIPGYLAKKLTHARYVVQDCRELYSYQSATGIAGKIGCLIEKIFTRRSDVVIAANAYRAKRMVKMFGLKEMPLNYENIRRLTYRSEQAHQQVEEECREFFADQEKFRIISTAGCDVSRTTVRMVEAMKGLGDAFELLLIGGSEEEDEQIIRETIRSLRLTNVKIFPRMDENHLKYFIEHCQVGMVTYHQRDLNNKYCASGKIYEFLFEGKPVVTSTNPPLKEFCEKYHVGQASDDYEQAIRKIADQYPRFCETVKHVAGRLHVEKNNDRLTEQIRRRLGVS